MRPCNNCVGMGPGVGLATGHRRRLPLAAAALAATVALLEAGMALAAQAEAPEAKKKDEAPAAAGGAAKAASPAPVQNVNLEAVMRGLWLETRFGGGYTVVSADMGPDPRTASTNTKEQLGSGILMNVGLGYDLNDMLALQLIGGANFIAGNNPDRVRDVSMLYGGAALRVALNLGDRLDFVTAVGGAFTNVSYGVDPPTAAEMPNGAAPPAGLDQPKSTVAVLLNTGLEYFVHVRHFAVGAQLTVFAPVSPFRLFIGVGPHLKYTF